MRQEGLSIVLLAAGMFFLTPCVLADWGPVKRLTWNSGESSYPITATDSEMNIHTAWCEKHPAMRRSITKEARTEARPGARLKG